MRNSRTMAHLTTMLLLCFVAVRVAGSAIPMWEFLSRDEKISHLYRIFGKQVARFCIDSSRPDCNKNLLVTGIRSLAAMDDNILDKLDPYQHNAKEMIWHAIVGTSRFSPRVAYDNEESYYTTGPDPVATSDSGTNGLAEESASADDYVRPTSEHSGPYLVGPMVIRVYPDGRPVPEDSMRPLPKDEDAEELKYARLPSVEEIESGGGNTFYRTPMRGSSKPSFFVTNKNHQRRLAIPISAEQLRHRSSSGTYEIRPRPQFRPNERTIRYY